MTFPTKRHGVLVGLLVCVLIALSYWFIVVNGSRESPPPYCIVSDKVVCADAGLWSNGTLMLTVRNDATVPMEITVSTANGPCSPIPVLEPGKTVDTSCMVDVMTFPRSDSLEKITLQVRTRAQGADWITTEGRVATPLFG